MARKKTPNLTNLDPMLQEGINAAMNRTKPETYTYKNAKGETESYTVPPRDKVSSSPPNPEHHQDWAKIPRR